MPSLPDLQNTKTDSKLTRIDQVGIKGIQYPITVKSKFSTELVNTVAFVDMSVGLAGFRGTHMSRFVEVLNDSCEYIDLANLEFILDNILTILNSSSAYLRLRFPYFLQKRAPKTSLPGLLSYECSFSASKKDNNFSCIMSVLVPVTLLCPCSKEISEQGAHNQRALVKVTTYSELWLEDVVSVIENNCSCPVYPLLKREDEKFVTEKAYDNPMFVEDSVRLISRELKGELGVRDFLIEVESLESIHDHSAFAVIRSGKF